MNGDSNEALLTLVLLVSLANLALAFLSWWRHDALSSRVTRLEANQASALTAAECRAIYERLSNIEGRLTTSTQLMQTIQKHLLERDE